MDVLAHIKKEHEKFRKMMAKIESAPEDTKKNLFKELYAEMHGHHEAEEHILFPLVKEKVQGENAQVVLEMIEEHALGKHQFSVLDRASVKNETWDAKFSVLKEVLEHHMEEEEKEFMPMAKKAMPKEKLTAVMEEFEAAHEQYTQEKKK